MINYDNLINNTCSLEEYIQKTEKAKQYYERKATNYKQDMQKKIKGNNKLVNIPYHEWDIEY